MRTLSEEQAFDAMVRFLELHWERTPKREVQDILSDINSHEYGTTADPGAFYEWNKCVDAVLNPHTGAAG